MGLSAGVAVGLVLSATGGWLWAQNNPGASTARPPTGKVASVDIGKVFIEYQRKKDLDEQMKTKQDTLQKENEKRRQAIDTKQAKVDRMDPSDPMYQAEVRDVLAMQIEYKNWVDLMQADVARETGVWTAKIYKEMLDSVRELAEREGIDAVFYRDEFEPTRTGYEPDAVRNEIRARKLVYWNPSIDMTTRVAEKLNETYRKMPATQMIQMAPGAVSVAPAPAAPNNAAAPAGKKP
jgi:Skp family chaperone for outer membrane proteins